MSSISCRGLFSDVLYRPFQCAHIPLEPFTSDIPEQNAILRRPDLTYAEYAEKWTDKPFILTAPVKAWPVYGKWTPKYFLQTHPHVKFRAEAVDWPMSKYMDYLSDSSDESPLYLFDRAFAEKTGISTNREASDAAYWSPDCKSVPMPLPNMRSMPCIRISFSVICVLIGRYLTLVATSRLRR